MMDDINLLRRLERVTAPAEFEESVLARLAQRRASAAQVRRSNLVRLTLAGAAATLLIGFVVLNVFVLRPAGPSAQSELAALAAPESSPRALQVMETVDYGKEARSASYRPGAVYILEQISNVSSGPIKY